MTVDFTRSDGKQVSAGLICLRRIGAPVCRRFPSSFRLLLENVLRNVARARSATRPTAALLDWPRDRHPAEAEIARFQPSRVLMHDDDRQHAGAGGHRRDARLARRKHGIDPRVAESGACRWTSRSTTRSRSRCTRAPTRPRSTCAPRAAPQRASATASCAGRRSRCRRAHPSAGHRDHAHDQPRAARDGRRPPRSATASAGPCRT